MSIKDILLKIKGKCQNSFFMLNHKAKRAFRADFFTAIVIILVAFAGFGLGRLSALEGKKTPIFIEKSYVSEVLSGDNVADEKPTITKTIQNSKEK